MNIITKFSVFFIAFFVFSANAFAGWTNQPSGTASSLQSIFMLDANTGYACGTGGSLRKTTNGGTTWTGITTGTTDSLNSVYFLNANTGYIVGANGLLRKTTNGGTNFTTIPTGGTISLKYIFMVSTDIGYIVGNSGKILKTTNSGANWINLTTGTTFNLTSAYFINSTIGAITSSNGFIYTTTNGGFDWLSFSAGSNANFTCVRLNTTLKMIAGIQNPIVPGGNIATTTNGGANWQITDLGNTRGIRTIAFPSVGTGYMFGDGGNFYKTIDTGRTWINMTQGTATYNSSSFINTNTGWIVGTTGTILKTTDGGLSAPAAPTNLVGFQSAPRKVFLSWFDNATNEQGYRVERGLSMADFQIIATLPPNSVVYVDSTVGNATYFYRVNAFLLNQNSPYSNVVMVGVVGNEGNATNVPDKFNLYQNYPNPFNPATKIKFDIAQATRVTMKLYNVLGKEVRSLVNNTAYNPGSYEITVDFSKLESGIYFYKIITPSYTEIKKMTYIK
ncbi:MAG TPA: YCF48-related protein [Ignavibacteria bacterium]|nr:YCF48-related protein [Ignavibacteria bacterium]